MRAMAIDQAKLQSLSFADLDSFAEDDHRAAFALFAEHAAAIVNEAPILRPALSATLDLRAVFRKALAVPARDNKTARLFFEENFLPCRVLGGDNGPGFLTGYYEPVVEGYSPRRKSFARRSMDGLTISSHWRQGKRNPAFLRV